MKSKKLCTRRAALQLMGSGALATVAVGRLRGSADSQRTGAIKQSICRWCYNKIPLEKLAAEAVKIGYHSIELIGPKEYQVIQANGLTCGMLNGTGPIPNCLNRTENHSRCERELRSAIEFAAAHRLPNVICFSGNRKGMADDEGMRNCAVGLKRVVGLAEEKKVTICMELLNSRVDHKDYMCDRTAWGVELVKKVGSLRFRLLYDIYHMQIMEGDVIRTIRANKDYIAHYHTGGVPGRHEIDDTQELNYPAVVRAILETGYEGFLGQEFIPAREPIASLAQGFRICNV
jgi:hydroxypyruvate isomerase